jgi:DNA-binding NarL/FixJ family response regulator
MARRTDTKLIKVVIVEDHRMFREWLGHMLAADGAFEVCGEADNIGTALEIIQKTKPDIAIVDLTLRGSSGLELIKNLNAQNLPVPVLVLSMHESDLYAERVLRAGARGYVGKHEASSTLAQAIREVLDGKVFVDEKVTARILKRMTDGGLARTSGMESLADRELEVFQLIGKGYNARKIAEQLHLGESTVETYRARIKEKLQLKNAAELYSRAAQWILERGV